MKLGICNCGGDILQHDCQMSSEIPVIKCEKCNNIITDNEDFGYNSDGTYICENCIKKL